MSGGQYYNGDGQPPYGYQGGQQGPGYNQQGNQGYNDRPQGQNYNYGQPPAAPYQQQGGYQQSYGQNNNQFQHGNNPGQYSQGPGYGQQPYQNYPPARGPEAQQFHQPSAPQGHNSDYYGAPQQYNQGPSPAGDDRGIAGALGGAAVGGFAGHKMGNHGIIGAIGGAVAGSLLEDQAKKHKKDDKHKVDKHKDHKHKKDDKHKGDKHKKEKKKKRDGSSSRSGNSSDSSD